MTRSWPAPLVVFSGMDGAGKSTQIGNVVERWRQSGQRPVHLWSRGGYTPGMAWAKRWMRWCSGARVLPPSGPSPARERAFSNSRVLRWWLRLAILDLIVLYGVAIRLWRWCGRPVLCDRYLADTQLDFELNFPQEPFHTWWLWRLLCWIAPRPTHAVLMMITPEESERRSARKHEPFPDSPETTRRRWSEYQRWADTGAWHVVDGHCEQEAVAQDVLRTLGLEFAAPAARATHAR